jgi:tetraacyldisaccharide 4'-kinase
MPGTWQQRLQRGLLRAWTGRGLVSTLLWPISLFYGALSGLRRTLYAAGALRMERVRPMVIVVGNVVAGGAGKTPTVIALVQHLRARGLAVGVVSRGYGRVQPDSCQEVQSDSAPQTVGDEPLLIQRATQAPVFVGLTRYAAACALLARHPQTQVLVCDDGLQHYALYRDLEVCVFDDRGVGNNRLLPAGPLREPWPRRAVTRAGQSEQHLLVLHTGQQPAFAGYSARRALAPYAINREDKRLAQDAWTQADTRPVLALAGIAQPESFFGMLQAQGWPVAQTLALSDHYDFDSLPRSIHEGYRLICTEKDAAKLWQTVPDAWAVPLRFEPTPDFFAAVDAHVERRKEAALSSLHGHPTT